MANSLYKWCKSKINGYKHIAGSHSEFGSTFQSENTLQQEFMMTPSAVSHETAAAVDNNELDVSNSQRQDFAFTLYDFDGPGHVTQDDIAGLAHAICEAIQSALKVTSGCRTISVNLTVRPDTSPLAGKPRDVTPPEAEDPMPERIPIIQDTPEYTESPVHHRHRKISVERQELCQIIQANMERNNLYYPPLTPRKRPRKRHCKCCPSIVPRPCQCRKKRAQTTPGSPYVNPDPNPNLYLSLNYKKKPRTHNKYKNIESWLNADKTERHRDTLSASTCSQSHQIHQHFHHHYYHANNPIII